MGPTGPAGPAGTGGGGGSSTTFTGSEIFPWNSTATLQDTDGGSTFALITDVLWEGNSLILVQQH